ncbi:MAG: DNA polymerase III subunit gamma/tau, partial [Halanaerobium sp. 4-GBenrich]
RKPQQEKEKKAKSETEPAAEKTASAEKSAAAASSKESPQKPAAAGGAVSLNQVKENWARVLKETRQLDISVQALLREGEPAAVEGKTVIIAFPESKKFHYKGASSNKALVARVLRNVLNEAVEIEFQLGAKKKLADEPETSAPDRSEGVEVVEDSKPAADRGQNSGAEIDPAVEEVDNPSNKAEESSKNSDQNLEAELKKYGFAKSDRNFIPHLTLGRSKNGPLKINDKFRDPNFINIFAEIKAVTLYQSNLKPEGPEYIKLISI